MSSAEDIKYTQRINFSKPPFLPAGRLLGLCSQCCTSGQKELEGKSTYRQNWQKIRRQASAWAIEITFQKKGENIMKESQTAYSSLSVCTG